MNLNCGVWDNSLHTVLYHTKFPFSLKNSNAVDTFAVLNAHTHDVRHHEMRQDTGSEVWTANVINIMDCVHLLRS